MLTSTELFSIESLMVFMWYFTGVPFKFNLEAKSSVIKVLVDPVSNSAHALNELFTKTSTIGTQDTPNPLLPTALCITCLHSVSLLSESEVFSICTNVFVTGFLSTCNSLECLKLHPSELQLEENLQSPAHGHDQNN